MALADERTIKYTISLESAIIDGVYRYDDMPFVTELSDIKSTILDDDLQTIEEARKELKKYLSGAKVICVDGISKTCFSRVTIIKHSRLTERGTGNPLDCYSYVEDAVAEY